MMEQYEQSGPKIDPSAASDPSVEENLKRLESIVARQDQIIRQLEKEIRRIKDKLDSHADHLNRRSRGG